MFYCQVGGLSGEGERGEGDLGLTLSVFMCEMIQLSVEKLRNYSDYVTSLDNAVFQSEGLDTAPKQ